jgi:lambda family phage portal protein
LNKILNKVRSAFKTEITISMPAGNGISANYAGYGGYNYPSYGSGAKFPSGMSAGTPIVIHDHFRIRQRSRDAMYDSTVAKSMVDRFADTVVDVGLKLKPTPKSNIIGITPEQAEDWAEKVAESFHLWAKSKKSHRSRINNFYQNQRLYEIFQQRDNDIFVRLFYGRDKDLTNPLQINFIDPNQIRGYSYTSTYYQYPTDHDGIKKDESGREIGYKIWYFKKDTGSYDFKDVPAIGARSGRMMMLHGFNPEYAGQSRGFSRLSHALQEFENLTDFTVSTIKKAIGQSSLLMAVENEEQDASNPLEGRVAGPISEYGTTGNPPSDSTNPQDTASGFGDPLVNYTAVPEATINEPGGVGVFNLKRGDKLNYLKDTSPSEQFEKFVNSFTSYLCASNGMPIEVLLMKFNANYSASRASLILFWRVAQIWRAEMEADFLDPVYEMWLSEEIAAGRISAPGWSDPRIKSAWLANEWAGAPMPNIDPLKTAAADEKYVELAAQTLDDVARNFNGSSGKANRTKLERQYEELPDPPWPRAPIMQEPEEKKEEDD